MHCKFGELFAELTAQKRSDVSGGEQHVVRARRRADPAARPHSQQHDDRERVLRQTHDADDWENETGEQIVPVVSHAF